MSIFRWLFRKRKTSQVETLEDQETDQPTYKQMKSELVEEILATCHYQAVVRRPNVFVVIRGKVRGKKFREFGFAKVCRPDKWKAKSGIEIAVNKAANHLAKRLLREYSNGYVAETETITWKKWQN